MHTKQPLQKFIFISVYKYCTYCLLQWKHNGITIRNGGYLVTHRKRLKFKQNKQEQEKYDKEFEMCSILKQHGFRVEHLVDIKENGTYDIHLNGIPADLKRTKGFGNIVKYAKHAIREQGAKIIIFQFDDWNETFRLTIENLKKIGIHGFYFLTSNKTTIHKF